MSDYISKSALLKNLWDWRLQECPVGVCDEETETYKTICECIKAVEELPTLDETEIIRKPFGRVVERLEEFTEQTYYKSVEGDMYAGERNKAYHNAIKILKEECGINE